MPSSNADRQRAYRERKLKEVVVNLDAVIAPPVVETPAVTPFDVEVKTVEPKSPPTFKERMMSKLQPVEPDKAVKKKPAKKGEEPNILMTVLPVMLANLVVTYSKHLFPPEYEECAVQLEEAQGVINPLMNIIARRAAVYGEMSQDALDLVSAFLCAAMTSTRIYVTYVNIKKKEEGAQHGPKRSGNSESTQRIERNELGYREKSAGSQFAHHGPAEEPEPNLAGGLRAYQAANNGIIGAGDIMDYSTKASYGAGYAPEVNAPSAPINDEQLRDSDAAEVAKLFKRDRDGRVRLGLLPA